VLENTWVSQGHRLCRNESSEREPWQRCHFSNRNHVSDDPRTSPGGGLWRRHRLRLSPFNVKLLCCEKCGFDMICALIRCVFEKCLDFHADELYSAWRADVVARIFAIFMLMRMNPHLGMNWTWMKVVLIWVNVNQIRILVQFLFFANPLILILIQYATAEFALILIVI